MKLAERIREALRYVARIGDAAILTVFFIPGLGLLLAPIVFVGSFLLLPSRRYRELLRGLKGRPARFEPAYVRSRFPYPRFGRLHHHPAPRR